MLELTQVREMQAAHKVWVDHNFPGQPSHHGLLGMGEEVGELMHAHLKKEQGIRHTPEECDAMIEDALGDVFIFALSYCNTNNIDLASAIEKTWEGIVSRRDWIADPMGAGNVEANA